MSATVNHKLCSQCRNIFQGHWQPRQIPDETQASSDTEREWESDTESRTSGTRDSEFYERPDWVQSPSSSNADVAAAHSPRHHSISDLQKSSQRGCPLCASIWDRVSDSLPELDSKYLNSIDRAIGIVTVRPAPDDGSEDASHDYSQATLDLEVSYFVDGNSHSMAAYLPLTVSFNLLPASKRPDAIPEIPHTSTTVSERTVKAITNWTQTCLHEDQGCWHYAEKTQSGKVDRVMPTRVLDVTGQGRDGRFIRLVEASNLDSRPAYVTLSHCWGGVLPVRLLSATYQKSLHAIDTGDLPQTFKDAIVFTRALGIRYLWIDALCIIQDSPDDWLRESLLMASVYSFGYLNIAATSSVDGRGGLFKKTPFFAVSPCIIHASWTGHPEDDWICLDQMVWERRVENAHLNTRAWVFQERLLAPRTVHFARDQVWWECRETRANESFPRSVPSNNLNTETPVVRWFATIDDDEDEDATSGNQMWLSLVQTYTAMKLTKDSDRLVALAGVALAVQTVMKTWEPHHYVAGLWTHDLPTSLLWRMASSGSRRTESYIAPSWSWASVKGAVHFDDMSSRETIRDNLTAEIVQVAIDRPTTGNAFGPVTSGSLTVRVHLYEIRLLETRYEYVPHMSKLKFGDTQVEFSNDADFVESLDEETLYDTCTPTGLRAVWCQISSFSPAQPDEHPVSLGLILQEVDDQSQDRVRGRGSGVYHRIGWLRLFHTATTYPELFSCGLDPQRSRDVGIKYLARHDDGRYTIKLI